MPLALITGGSSGIGLEYSRTLARMGYALALVGNREDELNSVAHSIADAFHVRVDTLCVDLSEEGAAGRVASWARSLAEPVDVLICNAGMFFMEYLCPENLGRVRAMMALHMESVAELCILLGSDMTSRGRGGILIMSSITDRIPAPGIAVYSATKSFLSSFGKSLSYEMRPFGVTVTTVRPAAVDTDLYNINPALRNALRRLGVIRSPGWLAQRGIKGMLKGRRTVSPGVLGTIVPALVRILPGSLIDRLGMRWIRRQ